jgi:hypothetical protein
MWTLLISQDLLEIMEDGFVEETKAKGKDKVETLVDIEKKENRKKDTKYLYSIQQVISKKNSKINGATSSKDTWPILQREFQGSKNIWKGITLS